MQKNSELGTSIPSDLLRQLLQETLGTRVEWIACEIGNQHPDYLVLLVRLRHPPIEVVVKLAGPAAPLPCPFERTAMLHRLVVTRTTIPMPEVLAVDVSYNAWPWRYMIKTHIPGQEWAAVRQQMDREQLADAYRQIGNAVAQLHAIHFPRFGELQVDGSIAGEERYFTALARRARSSIKKADLNALFLSLLERRQHLFLGIRQASLCHEDLHKHNILFRYQQGQWRLATILDFDKAWAGHHEIDLARLEFWEGGLDPAFWRAYEAVCAIEPRYEQRRPLYQFLWCLEYARSTEEHLEDTRRLCVELGLPCVEGFE